MVCERAELKARFESLQRQVSKDASRHLCMLLLNIDRFKRVNDLLGLEAGDAAIAETGRRLQLFLSQNTGPDLQQPSLCRLHADDFVILWSGQALEGHLPPWVDHLVTALSEPMEIKHQRFVFSHSVGVAAMPAAQASHESLLAEADVAMRAIKLQGGNGALLQTRDAGWNKATTTEHHLIHGLEQHQFHPFFQPKVCVLTGEIVGFEALLRWVHPERGLIPLSEFLPLLQNSGLMIDAGLQVFEEVTRTLQRWRSSGHDLPVSFNLSNGELLSPAFRQGIMELLRNAGLAPHHICLEITETVLANLGETGETIVQELRACGFQLSLDDFGVGTSSLARLRNIPLSEIKIDRSFVEGIVSSNRNFDLLRGIVNLGKSLGLSVVLEGVESEAQLNLARSLGDLTIQGFYYSRAVDPTQALRLAQTQPFLVH